jgi:hypothetical protein
MALEIRLVHPHEKNHEKIMWDSLASTFSELFSTSPRKALLLGNFNCEQQFDAVLVWQHGVAIFECKADHGMLHAPENESWYIEDRLVKAGGKLNPLGQVRRAKEALADRMGVRWHGKFHDVVPPRWMFAAGRVVFNAGTEWQDLLDHSTKKWFGIQTLDRVAATFKDFRIHTYDLTDQQVAFIGDAILGKSTRPRVSSEYNKYIKVAPAGVKLGALSLGGMVREFHDSRSSMDKDIKEKIPARVQEFGLADDDGFLLFLHDVLLENGERNITVGQNFTGEARMERLTRGLRLGIQQNASGLCSARLWQARVNADGTWSNRRAATLDQLNEGARMNVGEKLKELGARQIGTKGDLLGDTTKSRSHLYATFPSENTQAALAAYCLTTVLPLLNDYGMD